MATRRSLRKEPESTQKRRRSLRLQGRKNLPISYQRSLAYQGSTSSKITECTTPRTLFKKVLQILPIASPLVPINPDTSEPGEPVIRLPSEQILTSDLESSLSESASQVKCRVSLLKTKSKKICLSEFERDLNKQFDSNAAQSSLENTSLTKSLQISFRTPAPLPIDEKKGLIRRPKNYRGINVKDFEGGIEQNLLHGQESQSYLLAVQTATLLTSDVEMNAADTELFAHPLPCGQNKDFSDAPSQHTTAKQSLARRSVRPSSQTFWPTDENSGTDFGVSECGQRQLLGSRTEFADESRSMPEERADGPAEEEQKKQQDAVEELVDTGDTGEVEAIPQGRLFNFDNAEQETLHRDTYEAQLLSLPEEYLTTEMGPVGSSTPVHANLTEASSGHLSPLLKERSAKNSVKEMVAQIIEELDRSAIPAVVGQGISEVNLEEELNERAIHVLQNNRATTPGRCVSRKNPASLERTPRKGTTGKINQQVGGGKTIDGLAMESEQSVISEAEMDPESEEMSEAETDLENADPTEKTPAFVRARAFQCTSLLSTPPAQKMAVSRSSIPQPSIKKALKRATRAQSKKREPSLPSSMVKKLFSHYVRMPVAKDAFKAVDRCLALKSTFPLKTEEEIQELLEAAGYKIEYDTVMYKPLFFEDEEGKAELLVLKLRNQYLSEKQAYLRDLRAELGTLIEVRPEELRSAFCAIDSGLNEQILDYYVSCAFQVPKEHLDPAASIQTEMLMQRLMTADIKRQGVASGDAKSLPPSVTTEETESPPNG